MVLATLTSLLSTAQPYLSKLIIDQGLIGRRFDLLVWLCGAIVALAAIGFVLGGLNRWQYVRISGRILFTLREDVYRHLLRLSPDFFRERSVGDLVTRLDGDVAEVQRFSVDTLLAFTNSLLLLVATAAIMVALSWELALVAACVLPLQLLLRHQTRPHVAGTARAVREQAGRLTHFLVETLGSAKAVQAVAAERWEQDRLKDLHRSFLSRLVSQQLVGYATGGMSSLLSHASTAAVFIVGGYRVMHGSLTVGTLVAFTAYMARGTGSAVSMLNLYTAYQRATVSLHRVRQLLDTPPVQQRGDSERVLESHAAGRLTFDRVRLHRAGATRPLIDELSIDIAPGSKVVLYGESGAGKSTLVDLVRRFAEPDAGRILIDGVDLSRYEIESLRRHVAVLETEPVLFRGSLLHNLRYGNFDVDESAVLDAARRAGALEFIAELPQGLATEIGSGGMGLSAGQRQRVAIVRALLGDPVLLFLDEATSNLDAASTQVIHELIDEHFAHRTRLVITHAPQTVPRAEFLYELRDSRLINRNHASSHV